MGTEIQKTNGSAPPAGSATVEIAPRTGEIIKVGFDTLQGFEALQRVGKAFAASSLVPEAYRGVNNLANCVIAVEMASRIGASPLMVMQNLYIVHGRPAWSAQFLISAFNSCGRFAAIRYRFTGEKGKETWGCSAYTKELASGDEIVGPEVTIGIAKAEGWAQKNGSKWQTIPQLMLTYRAATFLIRTTAPELTMGLKSADEMEDIGPSAAEEFQSPPPALPIPEESSTPTAGAAPAQPVDELAAAQELLKGVAAADREPGQEG
jgi:hypothetical protein